MCVEPHRRVSERVVNFMRRRVRRKTKMNYQALPQTTLCDVNSTGRLALTLYIGCCGRCGGGG